MRMYTARTQKVFIERLKIDAFIGVKAHEYDRPQPLLVSVWLDTNPDTPGGPHAFIPQDAVQSEDSLSLDEIICYAALSDAITTLVQKSHTGFVETLAEEILQLCFQDMRIEGVRVRLDKPEAITGAETVGIDVTANRF